ncbi:MAG TPA: hypothetical protein VGJ20_42365, partial [Xanthobacteraceae bacterium]
MIRDIVLKVTAAMAKVEAAKIGDRARAGMARAKAHGTKSGKRAGQQQPPDRETRDRVAKLVKSGVTVYEAAKQLGIHYKTAQK